MHRLNAEMENKKWKTKSIQSTTQHLTEGDIDALFDLRQMQTRKWDTKKIDKNRDGKRLVYVSLS